jgi:anthranilate synthase component 1
MNLHLKSVSHTRLADTDTPVSIYLRLRDRFAETLLLEHAEDAHTRGFSYICCDPLAGITLDDQLLTCTYPDGRIHTELISAGQNLVEKIDGYRKMFTTDRPDEKFAVSGLFGYFSYNAVPYFEQIRISRSSDESRKIPDIRLAVYRYVIVYDHFKHELTIVHFYYSAQDFTGTSIVDDALRFRHTEAYPFKVTAEERSDQDDKTFLEIVEKGKQHCYRGDVFQVVLSREFEISFTGDEFNVYRALRSINPSQYLFFFDYGGYRLFGSSPEAQLKIHSGKATLHPIAGTYRRTGSEPEDKKLATALLADKKEQAEHVMLVDLARNDLSKTFKKIEVPVFKRIQAFSHVLHIVSEVTGEDPVNEVSPIKVLADTFPAGTLSGAPKYRAMQLIDEYECSDRGFYGGCLGFVGFDGSCNQAIMIRSFLSKNNLLRYRAGAGIVAASIPENELAEVNNKIAALRKAIQIADSI